MGAHRREEGEGEGEEEQGGGLGGGQLGGRPWRGGLQGEAPWGRCPVATLLAVSCVLLSGSARVREQETGGR
jgi:hypothetical protein